MPLIGGATRRGRVRWLLGLEWNRILQLLELLMTKIDSRQIERDPDLPRFVDRHGMRPADTHVVGQGRRSLQVGDAGFRVVVRTL